MSLVLVMAGGILKAQTLSWTQIGDDLTAASGNFGANVSMNSDGSIVAVGNYSYNSSTGYVAVYQNVGGSWIQMGSNIAAEASGDQFGRYTSLSSDGLTLAVGAPLNDGTSGSTIYNCGSVRVYQYSGGSWNKIGNDIDGDAPNDQSGTSICLNGDGTIVAVGASQITGGIGSAKVYEYNGTDTWNQLGMELNGTSVSDRFGYSVSLSSDGSILAVGAYGDNGGDGVTRVYEYATDWAQLGTDIAGVASSAEASGVSVSLNAAGTYLAVGAYKTFATWSQAGSTRIFNWGGSSWNQVGGTINGQTAGEQSGKFVDISSDGTMVAIGAPLSVVNSLSGAGRTRVYKYSGSAWGKIDSDITGSITNASCGYSVALSDDGTIVSAGIFGSNLVRNYIIKTMATWTGATDTDWHTATNWSISAVPDAGYNVVIPAGLTNYPTISAPATCFNLTIGSGSETSTGALKGQSNLTASGKIAVQRYMSGVSEWHLISSPAAAQTKASFLTTNTTIASKGSSPVYRAMADYNETGNAWNSFFTDAQGGTMGAGVGYEILTSAAGVITFTGALQGGAVAAPVTTAGSKWNSVGNPYPSPIFINEAANAGNNFLTVNAADLDGSFQSVYVWNPTTVSWDIISLSGAAYTAAVGQGFMVKVNTGVTSLDFTTAMQDDDGTVEFKGGAISLPEIRIIAKASGKTSATEVKFKEGMTSGLDKGYDVGMFKTDFNLYTRLIKDNGVDFGIQYLPENYLKSAEIALGLETKTSGTVEIFAEVTNLPEGTSIVLEDRFTGTFTELINGDIYAAQVEKSESGKGRFYLHTSSAVTSVDGITTDTDFNAYYSNERIVIAGQVNGKAKAMLFDVMGRKITDIELERSAFNFIPTSGMKNGIYMLNIQYESGMYSKKIAVSR